MPSGLVLWSDNGGRTRADVSRNSYNAQVLLSPPVIKIHTTSENLSNENRGDNLTWHGSIRNLGKFLWEHACKLMILGLATQVATAQASATNATQQNYTLGKGFANQTPILHTLGKINQTFTGNTTLDSKVLPTLTNDWSSASVSQTEQGVVNFATKDYTNSTKISINSSVNYALDRYMEINRQLLHKILYEFDKIDDHLHALIEMSSTDKKDELLETKSSQRVLSRVIRSSVPFSPREECTVSKDSLDELNKVVQDRRLNVDKTQRKSNCELSDSNIDNNCEELLKLLQCGFDKLKNAFTQATQNTISLEQYDRLQNAYNDLSNEYQKNSDQLIQQYLQDYMQKLDNSITRSQELSRQLYTNFLELKQNIKDLCISEIGHGHIEKAVSKFKNLNDFNNATLLSDIVSTAYTSYAQMDKFENIIQFIEELPWYSHYVLCYETLYQKMDINSPKVLILAKKVQEKIEKHYTYSLDVLKKNLEKPVKKIIDAWAYNIRHNNYQQIIEFAKHCNTIDLYCYTIDFYLGQLTEKAYAYNLENAETIIGFSRDLPYFGNSAVVLLSLFKQMEQNDHLNSYQLLMLAYDVKEYMDSLNIPSIYDKFIILKNNLPSSVRGLIWNGNDCIIRNREHDECLYAANNHFSYDTYRRRVFTWTPGNDIANGRWKIVSSRGGKIFTIQNIAFNYNYLYAASGDFAFTKERRNVFTWSPGGEIIQSHWHIVPVNNGQFFTIQNTEYNEYLYAANNNRDADRRYVYTCRKNHEFPTADGHWQISC